MSLLTLVMVALSLLGTRVAAAQTYPYPLPTNLTLAVREIAGVARSGEIVRSGVPLPRSLNVRDPGTLTLVDEAGLPVVADFTVLARWDAGRSVTTAPIQWVQVTFAATVPANGATVYRLVTDGSAGSSPVPPVPITIAQSGNQVIVNTGAATFQVGGSPGVLFDEIRLANGTVVAGGGTMSAKVASFDAAHTAIRRVSIEHAGRLSAVVVVEGAYDVSVGAQRAAGLGSRRRYVFSAGSATVLVRQSAAWEGANCGLGQLTCAGVPNGVLVEQLRDELTLNLGSSVTATAVGAFSAPEVTGAVGPGASAFLRQRLRSTRTAPLAFESSTLGGAALTGVKADGGVLAASGAAGTVAVALDHMHRYEPQALRLLSPTSLAVDLVDDRVWLGARQGLFATMAVSALPGSPTRGDLDRVVWAPLNHPLRAWPAPEWFASSDAVDEFPVGQLPTGLTGYDALVRGVLDRTVQLTDTMGLPGLMTFGLYPRTWANPIYLDELDCDPGRDPTPGDTSDNLYWCATWTDYHSATMAAPIWAMRSGQVSWIDEVAVPAALRMLHTQVLQCDPTDTFRLCWQAPTGYGGYRLDFNASHQYWDNLFLYYWLTGDYTVVEFLARGAEDQRRFQCQRRPASACQPDDPPPDPFATVNGRVGMQWQSTFRFLGLAGSDATYLEDYRANLARAVTQWYVEADQGGTRYGFWTANRAIASGATSTDQLWMTQLYDMNVLFRLQRDTSDAPIGIPPIPPSQVLAAWARTLATFAPTAAGSCAAQGTWPNALNFSWAGTRIGGTLSSISANETGSDPCLYASGLATVPALLVRAGDRTGSSTIRESGRLLAERAITSGLTNVVPLAKEFGIHLARLHAAVGRLTPVFSTTCSFVASPLTASVPAGGGSGTVTVSTTPACSWTALSDSTWLTVSSGMGTGSGTVSWTVAPNTGAARTGMLIVAGQIVTVSQSAAAGSGVPVPSNLTATVVDARVTLSWVPASVPGVTGYLIEAGSGTGLANIVTLAVGTSSQFVASAVPPGTYFVRVRALTGSAQSAASNEVRFVVGLPGAPSQLTATVSGFTVTLQWIAPDSGGPPTTYVVQAGSASGQSNLASVPIGGNQTALVATNVAVGRYFVRVSAVNAFGSSAASNEVIVTVGSVGCTTAPLAPAGLQSSVAGSRVDLNWTLAAGGSAPTTFIVEAGSTSGAANLAAIDIGSSATSFAAQAPRGTYFVRVRARNVCGTSPPSPEATVVVP
jgi:hypothetical protein